MTWTDIGPRESAAQAMVELMTNYEQNRTRAIDRGDKATADNIGHIVDELFDCWQWLKAKDPLPTDVPPKDEFMTWLAQLRG